MIPSGPWSFDLTFSHAIQSYQPGWLTTIAKIISVLNEPEVIVPAVIVVAGWLYIRRQKIRDLMLILIMAGNALTLLIKYMIQRPRPTAGQINVIVHESATGFPSGHALAAVLTAGAIWIVFRHRQWSWLHPILIIYALAIGWSRIYLGVHWLSDVLAGYFFGLLWLLMAILIIPKKQPGPKSAPAIKI